MSYKESEKARLDAIERKRRYRKRKHIEKYGIGAGDMKGKHGNHARGSKNGRWNPSNIISSHGYICLRVPLNHPHAFGSGYCYEHIFLMVNHLGRALNFDEVVHHINGNIQDNRLSNLKLMSRSNHMKLHQASKREYPNAKTKAIKAG